MHLTFPSPALFNTLPWADIQPYFDDLESRDLDADTVHTWFIDWTRLAELLRERGAIVRVATVKDTTDAVAEAAYKDYLQNIFPHAQKGNNALTKKLLASGLVPEGMDIPLREMRVEAEIFREENLPLQTEEHRISIQFNKIVGAQTVEWKGEEYTITQLGPLFQQSNRATREQIWRLINAREQADRAAINELWTQVLSIRQQQAANAGFKGEHHPDYRAYRWKERGRFDYTPEDCRTFHDAIEKVAVPAAGRVYEKHRQRLSLSGDGSPVEGVESLRPWDLDLYQQTYPIFSDEIQPFKGEKELLDRGSAVFHRVDPTLGAYFDTMRAAGLIDFLNRKGKGPGAFCTSFEASHLPFIFGNAAGQASDVNTLLHESGHAFHNFEVYRLPYYHQRNSPMEFNEVASMAMELLASPYLTHDCGGYYTPEEAARARIRHLEKSLLFWPYMAVVDAFQHWIYENPGAAADPLNCDAAWVEQWDRFIPFIDYTGLGDAKTLGWHRKRHIHRSPFYYIEYGLAQLGATQVWGNALRDQARAVAAYKAALSLGGTVPLPELYCTAGAKFAFDVETLGDAVALIENAIKELETV